MSEGYFSGSSYSDPLNEYEFQGAGPQAGSITRIPKFLVLKFAVACLIILVALVVGAYRLTRFLKSTADDASETIFEIYRGSNSCLLDLKKAKKRRRAKKSTHGKAPNIPLGIENRQGWLVIGGNGFIGRAIAMALLHDPAFSDEVIVFDVEIPEESERDPRITYVRGTITVRDHLDRVMRINDRWDRSELIIEEDDDAVIDGDDYDGNYDTQQEGLLDTEETRHLRRCRRPPGVVFHAAGLNPSIEHVEDDMTLINGMGAMNVVDSCIAAKVERLVFTSSASVGLCCRGSDKSIDGETEEECMERIVAFNSIAQKRTGSPATESLDSTSPESNIVSSNDISVKETSTGLDRIASKLAPRDGELQLKSIDYDAKLKLMVEAYIKDNCAEYEWFHAVCLRPSMVVGEKDGKIVQPMLEGSQTYMIDDGNNIVDFVHVECVSRAHVQAAVALNDRKVSSKSFFITGGRPITVRRFLGLEVDWEDKPLDALSTPEMTAWGQPVPKCVSKLEAYEAADWGEQVYNSSSFLLYNPHLNRPVLDLLSTSWWFSSTAAKRAFGWEAEDILAVMTRLVRRTGNRDEQKKLTKEAWKKMS